MSNFKKRRFKFPKVLVLTLVVFSSLATSAFASLDTSPNLRLRAYVAGSTTYVEGGIFASTYENHIDKVRAYMELYRDGTYLGSALGEDYGNVLGGLSSTAANITPMTHYLPGTYQMTWSARLIHYSGSDTTDAGSTSIYKSSTTAW